MVNQLMLAQAIDTLIFWSKMSELNSEIWQGCGGLPEPFQAIAEMERRDAAHHQLAANLLTLLLLATPRSRPTSTPAAIKRLSPTMKRVILHMYKHGDTGFGGGDEIATSATCAALSRRGLIEAGICNEWGNFNWYTYHLNEAGRRVAESLVRSAPAAIKQVSVAVEVDALKGSETRQKSQQDDTEGGLHQQSKRLGCSVSNVFYGGDLTLELGLAECFRLVNELQISTNGLYFDLHFGECAS